MNAFRGWLLVVLALALVQLPARSLAQGVEPSLLEGVEGVTEDGRFLLHKEIYVATWRQVAESIAGELVEKFQLEADHAFGDSRPDDPRSAAALDRQSDREQAPTVRQDRRRWAAFLKRHPLARFRGVGGESPQGWRVRISAPGCGLKDVVPAEGASIDVDRCPAPGEVRFELVHGREVHPWLTWPMERAERLALSVAWSESGQWVHVDGTLDEAFRAAIPRVQVFGDDPEARAAAARRLEQAGYRVAASGKAKDPHPASELYYLESFEAEARRIAALLGVAPERVQPLSWEAPAPVVVVLVPGPAPSPATP